MTLSLLVSTALHLICPLASIMLVAACTRSSTDTSQFNRRSKMTTSDQNSKQPAACSDISKLRGNEAAHHEKTIRVELHGSEISAINSNLSEACNKKYYEKKAKQSPKHIDITQEDEDGKTTGRSTAPTQGSGDDPTRKTKKNSFRENVPAKKMPAVVVSPQKRSKTSEDTTTPSSNHKKHPSLNQKKQNLSHPKKQPSSRNHTRTDWTREAITQASSFSFLL
ncbi:unnamed protein product [Caenorhabditis auriculariae]|uniref:Uncharacterized protein n=1 Tax=Caenorhabditis auriculariae TaxID=2777116 RepID=A0A8S1HB14_9PELO|nr:unnamed protein product [Caenorhabditis auriculariae]